VTLRTIALELVPPNLERGHAQAFEDAHKVLKASANSGLDGLIRHVMIPGMIEEDDSRPIPTREGEQGRFEFKCRRGATYGMTQLLYSDAIVGFLTDFAKQSDHRPEILLSFGFVPKIEDRVGLINWLIQDPGNPAVASEQEFVKTLAGTEPEKRRQLTVELYRRVIDGVAELGFPLSIHLEATYGVSGAAFDTFAEMLAY
jgi:hypothetical protein